MGKRCISTRGIRCPNRPRRSPTGRGNINRCFGFRLMARRCCNSRRHVHDGARGASRKCCEGRPAMPAHVHRRQARPLAGHFATHHLGRAALRIAVLGGLRPFNCAQSIREGSATRRRRVSSVHDQREPRNPELSNRDASRPANLLTTRCLPEPGTLDPGTLDPRCPHGPKGIPEPGSHDPELSTRDDSGTQRSRFRHLPFMSPGAQTLCHLLMTNDVFASKLNRSHCTICTRYSPPARKNPPSISSTSAD